MLFKVNEFREKFGGFVDAVKEILIIKHKAFIVMFFLMFFIKVK